MRERRGVWPDFATAALQLRCVVLGNVKGRSYVFRPWRAQVKQEHAIIAAAQDSLSSNVHLPERGERLVTSGCCSGARTQQVYVELMGY